MKKNQLIMSTGFALFSMFFGSGNLVFPLIVGQESEGHYLLAALGIITTGVIVPFLGVFGMMLYKGDLSRFFSLLGKRGTFLFSFMALALMGPFGVLARCLTVVHGALLSITPDISLPLTSLIMCLVIYLFAVNKNRIITVLGAVLTPFLLASIAAIAFSGLTQDVATEASSSGNLNAFKIGFFQGYQTMDLLAAFFFSRFVIQHLYQSFQKSLGDKALLNIFFKASLIGSTILASVYGSLVLLGWLYVPHLAQKPPQEMLGIIAMESLGSLAAPCVCAAVIFACLTTAIVLSSLFSEFIRKDILHNAIGEKSALLITLSIGFLVSTLDFSGIARFLGPILETIYPALIALTIFNIARVYFTEGRYSSVHVSQDAFLGTELKQS